MSDELMQSPELPTEHVRYFGRAHGMFNTRFELCTVYKYSIFACTMMFILAGGMA
jgi:hypothetical protein